ncbi:MAG: sigma-70 family RNA polymerase sigma factor [Acidimicrobiales bacterium]|nr:sigma-70 family RNA polymerase sigma factor [Acidimicrobiales bacterium]MCB9392962.1 sigma-70 family RNA polymerase sigma factor [Acidimicrobiaceae bacterium]
MPTTDHLDDHALVRAAVAGDRAATDVLLRRHYDRMYAVCRRITGNDADAADAAQEAMIAIVRGLARFDGRSSFGTWAYRIATNASLDELRRRRRRPTPADAGRGDDLPGDHDAATADPDGERRLDRVSDRMLVDDALRRVPEEFRIPLVMRDVGDLDYAEIAAALDVPVGTVKSRIARGRAALAQFAHAGNRGGSGGRPRRIDPLPDDPRAERSDPR